MVEGEGLEEVVREELEEVEGEELGKEVVVAQTRQAFQFFFL